MCTRAFKICENVHRFHNFLYLFRHACRILSENEQKSNPKRCTPVPLFFIKGWRSCAQSELMTQLILRLRSFISMTRWIIHCIIVLYSLPVAFDTSPGGELIKIETEYISQTLLMLDNSVRRNERTQVWNSRKIVLTLAITFRSPRNDEIEATC